MDRIVPVAFKGLSILVYRIAPLLFRIISFSVWAMVYSLAAVWLGWNTTVERITQQWVKEAAEWRLPSSMDLPLYYFVRTMAHGLVLYGWILNAHVIVWLTKEILT